MVLTQNKMADSAALEPYQIFFFRNKKLKAGVGKIKAYALTNADLDLLLSPSYAPGGKAEDSVSARVWGRFLKKKDKGATDATYQNRLRTFRWWDFTNSNKVAAGSSPALLALGTRKKADGGSDNDLFEIDRTQALDARTLLQLFVAEYARLYQKDKDFQRALDSTGNKILRFHQVRGTREADGGPGETGVNLVGQALMLVRDVYNKAERVWKPTVVPLKWDDVRPSVGAAPPPPSASPAEAARIDRDIRVAEIAQRAADSTVSCLQDQRTDNTRALRDMDKEIARIQREITTLAAAEEPESAIGARDRPARPPTSGLQREIAGVERRLAENAEALATTQVRYLSAQEQLEEREVAERQALDLLNDPTRLRLFNIRRFQRKSFDGTEPLPYRRPQEVPLNQLRLNAGELEQQLEGLMQQQDALKAEETRLKAQLLEETKEEEEPVAATPADPETAARIEQLRKQVQALRGRRAVFGNDQNVLRSELESAQVDLENETRLLVDLRAQRSRMERGTTAPVTQAPSGQFVSLEAGDDLLRSMAQEARQEEEEEGGAPGFESGDGSGGESETVPATSEEESERLAREAALSGSESGSETAPATSEEESERLLREAALTGSESESGEMWSDVLAVESSEEEEEQDPPLAPTPTTPVLTPLITPLASPFVSESEGEESEAEEEEESTGSGDSGSESERERTLTARDIQAMDDPLSFMDLL